MGVELRSNFLSHLVLSYFDLFQAQIVHFLKLIDKIIYIEINLIGHYLQREQIIHIICTLIRTTKNGSRTLVLKFNRPFSCTIAFL